MIDPRCLGADVDRAKISPEARITGASYLTGRLTSVGPGAVVHDSRLHDTEVEDRATVIDSISTARGNAHRHRCDAAGRVVVGGAVPARIAANARVQGSTLTNTAVGAGSSVEDSSLGECRIGPDNSIRRARMVLTQTAGHVTIVGPTELSEAYVGHHATIDRRGYFEGVFSNTFRRLRFNEQTKRLEVIGAIDLPHVSRYGVNTINSTNSGKLLTQPEGILKELGPRGGLWSDPLLSHEQIELGPCCWVVPWTKVVGQSAEAHAEDESMVNDRLMTWLMPFAIAGFEGDATRGLVMPGELSVGLGPKQRRGAWAFTYAPGAVVEMIARLHAALPDDEKHVADTIVVEALQTAVEMTRAMAAEYGVDLSVPTERQPVGGWPRWIASTHALLRAHLDNHLWRFDAGRPVEWRQESSGRWVHPRFDAVLKLAPDALERQVAERSLENAPADAPDGRWPTGGPLDEQTVTTGGAGQGGESHIDAGATVDPSAVIGPGCRIGPGATVEAGATLWRADLDDCRVEARATVERSTLRGSRVGADTVVRSCRIVESSLGAGGKAEAATIRRSRLADRATVSPLVTIDDVETSHGAILGCDFRSSRVQTNLMAMHLAGSAAHVEARPTQVTIDGRTIDVPAVPMIGGGAVLRGTADAPIEMECSFVGSNAILEPGVRLGFGCFVLGRLPEGVELPPLTFSGSEEPSQRQIGGVLGTLSSTVITHFLGWAFQAVEPDLAPAVGRLVIESIERGREMIEAEREKRRSPDSTDAQHSPLASFSDAQLDAGEANYRRAIESGAWELVWRDGRLHFNAERGEWRERAGSVIWKGR